jgi:hypothetical protein
MTTRAPVSVQRPIWYDAQQVDETDLTSEQLANQTIEASIIDNHVGDGVLPEVLVSNVIYDSTLAVGYQDGLAIFPQAQPTDNNLGNQLSIKVTGSTASGRRQIKVCVIGLDFQSNLQYEIFYFDTNETQTGQRHFTKILVLLFNDFIGDPDLSFNLGGRILITEAQPMTLSRDVIMVAQDQQPNLFFRDFFLDSSISQLSLQAMLQAAMPTYNVVDLNIFTQPLDLLPLLNGDVTTQIGEKFIATTNNVQKVTLLLSVQNLNVGQQNNLVWTGDIVVSIYPLQTSIDCPTDFLPNQPIEFSPFNIPLGQISYNYNSLQAAGIVLNSVPQPVDFVFSNSPVANGSLMVPGNFYAVTIKRAGAANQCDILVAVGGQLIPNSEVTTFASTLWVDIPSEQMWFRIWTDAAKLSDGQAYDAGNGVTIPKTTVNPTTQATVDNSFGNVEFVGNDIFSAVLAAVTQDSVPVPSQNTGNPVDSRQQFVPQVKLLDTIDLSNLENSSTPLVLGSITDKNIKFFNPGAASITAPLYSATMAGDELLIRIIDDSTDPRYSTQVIALASYLLNGALVSAQFTPDAAAPFTNYRIASAQLCSMIIGDVDGNGIIDNNDLVLLNKYLGYNMNVGLPDHTVIVTNGITTTFTNGYQTLVQPFANLFNISFQLVDPNTGLVVASGTDGVLVANPSDPTSAQFTSASVTFNVIVGLSTYNLVILSNGAAEANWGGWTISGIDTPVDVLTIRKIHLTGDVFAQMMRADIDGDFVITTTDGYLLNNYIERLPSSTIPPSTYPAPSTNPYTKIGTRFNVIRLRVEEFVDRIDDYASNPNTRALTVHPPQDIFNGDGYLFSHNFFSSPIQMAITQQLTWDPTLVITSAQPKLVPAIFSTESGFVQNSCVVDGVQCNVYPVPHQFDPGRVDFFIPNNLIIGDGGELQRPDGEFYKVDFEVGTIVLEIPDGLFGSERTIDIMSDFIVDYTGNGATRLGFPSMRFADCSFVTKNAIVNDQIRFSVSVQSFSPNTNGLSDDGYYGAIVDGKMGVSVDFSTGLLTLNFTNLYQDQTLQTLSTKVQVNVFLKKGGFNNVPLFVDSTKVQNMLSLVSVFSGANVGGPSALVDMGNDVSGILPIVNGGTGLNSVGPFGTVLTSTGTGVNYQFVYDLIGVIPFSLGIADANRVPKTDGYGFLDPSFMYKNPVYICATQGVDSNGSNVPTTVGAFTFRFDSFIMEGWSSINLEAIIETTNAADTASINLYNVNTHSYLTLTGMSTVSTSAVLVRSQDISSQMQSVFTTVSALSNGAALPQGTINVISTTGFPTSGTLRLESSLGAQIITYTGISPTTFTGCTGGTGNLATGYLVVDLTDYVYEVQLSLNPTGGSDVAICKMARLVITYNNLTLNNSVAILPPTSHSSNFVPFLPSPTPM